VFTQIEKKTVHLNRKTSSYKTRHYILYYSLLITTYIYLYVSPKCNSDPSKKNTNKEQIIVHRPSKLTSTDTTILLPIPTHIQFNLPSFRLFHSRRSKRRIYLHTATTYIIILLWTWSSLTMRLEVGFLSLFFYTLHII